MRRHPSGIKSDWTPAAVRQRNIEGAAQDSQNRAKEFRTKRLKFTLRNQAAAG